jgi:cardiolipin synthase
MANDGFRRSLPNVLTVLRIVLALPAALCVVADEIWAGPAALILFVFAASLDFFDGMLARRWKMITELGRALDPIADKILVAAVLLGLAADGLLVDGLIVPALIIVGRDFLICGMREFAADARRTLHVSKLAKWKTAAELTAITLLLASPALPLLQTNAPALYSAGAGLLWVAAFLSAWTGAAYVRSVFTSPRP